MLLMKGALMSCIVITDIPRTIYERANYFYSFAQLTFHKRFRIPKEIAAVIFRE